MPRCKPRLDRMFAAIVFALIASATHSQPRGFVASASFAPTAGEPFTVWIGHAGGAQPGDQALVPRLYATFYDHATGRSGPTVVIVTKAQCASCPLSFRATLAAGSWQFGYYDSTTPDFDQLPDSYFEIVVAPAPTRVIEFVNARSGHYLVTADPGEIALLDAGGFADWSRTGESFRAGPANANPGARPVCRLYGRPEAGLDTHFLSDDPLECEAALARWPDKWVLESSNAFTLPMLVDFPCGADFPYGPPDIPVYRLYNGKADVNHRYTTSKSVRDEMIAAGWILEARANGEWSCTTR